MYSFILTIHVFLALGITLLVLMQRSEGGALGGLGGNANATNFLTGRQTGDFLSKSNRVFIRCFYRNKFNSCYFGKSSTKGRKTNNGSYSYCGTGTRPHSTGTAC